MSRFQRYFNLLILYTNLVYLPLAYATGSVSPTVDKTQVNTALAGLAIPFEENQGQIDPDVAFQARTLAGPLFVTKTGELVWTLTPPQERVPEKNQAHKSAPGSKAEFIGPPAPSYSVVERFVNGQPQPNGATAAATQVSYFHGNDRDKWQSSVPTWSRVNLGQVWPGVEVSLAARGKNAEKLFTVAPGANANAINLEVSGGALNIAANGGLLVTNQGRPVISFTAPLAWQEVNNQRQPVQVAYRIEDSAHYGFNLGNYDPAKPVFIDPLLQSTYLGGSNEDQVTALAVTSDAVYVAGYTYSSNFPGTSGGAQATCSSCASYYDAWVAKLSLDLKTLTQATYLGGSSDDYANALAVTNNAVFVAGYTYSSNFPGTSGGAQATCSSCTNYYDAWVAKLSLDLKTLTQATYLGGSSDDYANALAVTNNAVFVAGYTYSSNFPGTSGGAQATCSSCTNYYDAWVAKLSLDLKTLTQATYLGGSSHDWANALAVTSDAVFVAGYTYSSNFPGTSGGAQAFGGGSYDAWVAKLSLDLKNLTQATYLGGSSSDYAIALAVTSDAVFVAGGTYSSNFPGTSGGAQATCSSCPSSYNDAWVAKLSLDLKTLTQATYLGGSSSDYAIALAVTSDAVFVAGQTYSSDFPGTSGGAQAASGGNYDAWVAKLSLDLKTLTQATYLGGSSHDLAYALAVTSDAVFVAGKTYSSDFPGTSGGAQAASGGNYDAWVAKLSLGLTSGYNLTVSRSGNGAGVITSNPAGINCGSTCSFILDNNTSVTLTATLATGSVFSGWSGACSGNAATCTVTMDAAKNVTATFNLIPNVVTPSATAGGTFTPNTAQTVNYGTNTSFTVTPNTGYARNASVGGNCPQGSWNGNVWTTGAITANCTVKFIFTQVYTVTPSTSTGGSLSPNTPQIINTGTTAQFTLTANTGYTRDNAVGGTCPQGNWNGDVWTTGTITSDCNVSFSFTINTYAVTPSTGLNGSLTPNSVQMVNYGATASFTATPNSGYVRDPIVTGTCPQGSWNGNVWTTGVITAACTVKFAFLPAYTVTPSAGNGGSISPNTAQIVAAGASLSFTATATTGYTTNTTVGGTCPQGSWNGNVWTTGAITANCNVSFSFDINTYTVTPSVGTGASINPSTPQTLNYGTTTAFTLTPIPGCTILSTVGGTCPQGSWNGSQWTTGVITANCSVTFNLNCLGAALNPALTWTTRGDQAWYDQNTIDHDGVSAAQSGAITDNQASHLETSVAGPGNLTFFWKVSSELAFDYLQFFVDDVAKTGISGIIDWQSQTFAIPSGTHTLRWTYSKDASDGAGSDAGWVDQVTYDGGPINGTCGAANGQILTTAPTTNLCSTGTASNVTGTGPWTWSCNGINNGTNASCSATLAAYTVTTSKAGTGSGTISGDGTFIIGTTVTLTATPNANSTFAGWSPSPCAASFTMPSNNLACIATFNLKQYTLSITKTGDGSGIVTSDLAGINCGTSCSSIYPIGTLITLTATPTTGSSFVNWSGDADCSFDQIAMNGNHSCIAIFALNAYTVTPIINIGGTVTPNTPQTASPNTKTSFTVVPKAGYINSKSVAGTCPLGSWNGNVWTTGNITANCTVKFNFLCLICMPDRGGWRAVVEH